MAECFYFGPRGELLFGALHRPEANPNRAALGKHGLLICYPGLEEHHRSIWPMRSLADQLARHGWCTMRFDYFGTGDSYGDCLSALPSRWSSDIVTAADEFIGRTDVSTLSFLCLRLGATLFSHSDLDAIKKLGVDFGKLILWDPVESGRAHLEELQEQESFRLTHQRHNYAKYLDPGRPELLGYTMTAARRKETEALNWNGEQVAKHFASKDILRVGSSNEKWVRQLNLEDGFLQPQVALEVVAFLKNLGET